MAALALALLLFSASSSLAFSSLFCLSSIILLFSIFWAFPAHQNNIKKMLALFIMDTLRSKWHNGDQGWGPDAVDTGRMGSLERI